VAGAFMAGFSVALLNNLKFDSGYRFLYLGQADSGPVTYRGVVTGTGQKVSLEEIHAHEVRFGLRYDFR
jgi:opacity protein-like surface antigen